MAAISGRLSVFLARREPNRLHRAQSLTIAPNVQRGRPEAGGIAGARDLAGSEGQRALKVTSGETVQLLGEGPRQAQGGR